MTAQEENKILAEAKELYQTFAGKASQLDEGKEDNDSEDTVLGSMNKVVLETVSKTACEPMLDLMNTANVGVETSREVANSVGDLPGPLKTELEEMPSNLKMEALTKDIPSAVRNIIDAMKTAGSDPSILYPRLLCGSIPVDPAKVGSLAKKYKALEILDGQGGGNDSMAQSRSMRGPPSSSAEAVTGIAGTFNSVAEPLMEGLDKIKSIHAKLNSTSESVRSLEGGGKEFEDLMSKQDEVTGFVDRLTSMFSPDGPGTPVSDGSRDIHPRGSAASNANCIELVEEGSQLVRSAQDFHGPIERAVEKVKSAGDRIAGLASELKELFELAMETFGKIVDLLTAFVSNLPRIIGEIKQFFVPTGFRALFMQPSVETRNLLDGVEKLKSTVPKPDEVEASARSVLDESESVSTISVIVSKISEVVRAPMELLAKLEVISSELPGKIVTAAKEALKDWAENFGENLLEDKIEDGIEDIAEMIGGEKLADAVGDLLPFGSSGSDEGKGNGGNGLGGMLNSFF